MKRTLLHLLSAGIFLSLAACAQAGSAATATSAPTVQPSPTLRPEPVARQVNMGGAILNVAEFLDEKRG